MKNFVKENWYKLMMGSSMMMGSFGFLIYAVSPSFAKSSEFPNANIPNNQKVIQVPVNDDGSINVKLSKEQIKEIKAPTLEAQKVKLVYSSYNFDLVESDGKVPTK